ncbi:hypothetical protein GYMLUDRAFT_237851 [Collybiopsis luxurians FD-317 M1]|nr:hypothetical protein GYMLUDRAFT_237851 [Collybiopsis luxurians FD-317 M1]
MERSSTGFKRDSRNKTPPPAYTATVSGPSSSSQPGHWPQSRSEFDPYSNINYNPWANVPTSSHPNPLYNPGPTPASALQIPYAYYDPRSAHSLAEADARAKLRFWLTLLFVLGVWILCGLLVNWVQLRHPEWIEVIAEAWHRWVDKLNNGTFTF